MSETKVQLTTGIQLPSPHGWVNAGEARKLETSLADWVLANGYALLADDEPAAVATDRVLDVLPAPTIDNTVAAPDVVQPPKPAPEPRQNRFAGKAR